MATIYDIQTPDDEESLIFEKGRSTSVKWSRRSDTKHSQSSVTTTVSKTSRGYTVTQSINVTNKETTAWFDPRNTHRHHELELRTRDEITKLRDSLTLLLSRTRG